MVKIKCDFCKKEIKTGQIIKNSKDLFYLCNECYLKYKKIKEC